MLPHNTHTTMLFIDQLKQASDATLAATMYNACEIAAEDVPQGDIAQATRVATALKVIEQCRPIIKERIRKQGKDGTMIDCVMNAAEIAYAPTQK
tara:strand:+ start:801 stop:1085 length:285 start_codon:yes stop_codon:yes gene_type:complete